MTADYFDTEKTGGSKDSIEITIDVKAEKVMDFANEIRNATLDEILEIIDGCKFSYKEDEVSAWDGIQWHNRALEQAKQAVEALRGEQE